MIIGIGLPRTGTRSLAAALDILGYSGSHYCELIGRTKRGGTKDSYIIDNSRYGDIINNINPNDDYIMTYRNSERWRNSIFGFRKYEGPDIEDYKRLCITAFSEKRARYLVFNILEGWDPLCKFLDKKIPAAEYPFIT